MSLVVTMGVFRSYYKIKQYEYTCIQREREIERERARSRERERERARARGQGSARRERAPRLRWPRARDAGLV